MTQDAPVSGGSRRTRALIGIVVVAAVVAVAYFLTIGRSGSNSASGPSATPTTATAAPAGPLVLGTLLPATGELAFLGAPEFAGVRAAVSEINEAGGVLDMPVKTIEGDSGNSTELASITLERAIDEGAQVIIGPATSTLTLSVLGQSTAAGVVALSPSSTSIELSDPLRTKGLFFRTIPPDNFQGTVLANLAYQQGKRSVAIMQIDDVYGDGLGNAFTVAFERLGGRVVAREVYSAGALTGVEGVIAGAAADSQMQAALLAANPSLTSFEFGPEAYDTAIITALAAQAAGSVTAADIAAQIPNVTALGNTACTTYAACLKLLQAGEKISYQGPSGSQGLRSDGDPSVAVMGIWVFGADGQISPLEQVSGEVPRA